MKHLPFEQGIENEWYMIYEAVDEIFNGEMEIVSLLHHTPHSAMIRCVR